MKNSLVDLNDHLFSQLERLNDENIKGDDLKTEIERSKALTSVSSQIVSNASIQLQAIKLATEHQGQTKRDLKNLLPSKTGALTND